MLTTERLAEVSWALEKLGAAQDALERLLEGEPVRQPPGERELRLRAMREAFLRSKAEIERLFS